MSSSEAEVSNVDVGELLAAMKQKDAALKEKEAALHEKDALIDQVKKKAVELISTMKSEKEEQTRRANDLQEQLSKSQSACETLKDKAKKAIEDARARLKDEQSAKESINAELATTRGNLQGLTAQLADRDAIISELRASLLGSSKERAIALENSERDAQILTHLSQAQSQALEQREEALQKLISVQSTCKTLEAELQLAREKIGILERERSEHIQELTVVRSSKAQVDGQLNSSKERNASFEAEIKQLQQELASTREQFASLEAERSRMEHELNVCSSLHSKLEQQVQDLGVDNSDIRAELGARVDDLNRFHISHSEMELEVKSAQHQVQALMNENAELRDRLSRPADETTHNTSKHKDMDSGSDRLIAENSELRSELAASTEAMITAQNSNKNIEVELNSLRDENSKLRYQLAGSADAVIAAQNSQKVTEGEMNSLRTMNAEQRSQLAASADAMVAAQNSHKIIESELNSLRAENSDLRSKLASSVDVMTAAQNSAKIVEDELNSLRAENSGLRSELAASVDAMITAQNSSKRIEGELHLLRESEQQAKALVPLIKEELSANHNARDQRDGPATEDGREDIFEHVREQLSTAQKEKDVAETRARELQTDLTKITLKADQLQQELAEVRDVTARQAEREQHLTAQCKIQANEREMMRQKLSTAEITNQKLEEDYRNELADLRERLEQTNIQVDGLQTELESARTDLVAQKQRELDIVKQHRIEAETHETALVEAAQLQQNLTSEKIRSTAAAERIETLESELAAVTSFLNTKDSEIGKIKKDMVSHVERADAIGLEMMKMRETIEQERQVAENHATRASALQTELNEVHSKLQLTEHDYQSLMLRYDEQQKECESFKSLLQQEKTITNTLTTKLQEMQTRITQTEKNLQEGWSKYEVLKLSEQTLQAAVQDKERELVALREETQAIEKRSRQQVSQAQSTATQKVAQLNTDLEAAHSEVQKWIAKYSECETNLTATSTAHGSLQEQYNRLTEDFKNTQDRLETEKREMMKKMKNYVEKILAEKTTAENSLQTLTLELAAEKAKSAEVTNKLEQLQHHLQNTTDQAALDKECYDRELQSMLNSHALQILEKNQLIERLEELASEGQRMTEEQIKEAQARLTETELALVENKTKRLAARSEMISLATALEKAQEINAHTQHLLQYTLIPTAVEQVSMLEGVLPALEAATSVVANKRTVKIQTRTQEMLASRFRSPGAQELAEHDPQSRDSPRSAFGLASSPMLNPVATSPFVRKRSSGKLADVFVEGVTQVAALASEMARVTAGLKLLTHSIERLNELVALDTRCCGSMYDLVRLSVNATFANGYGVVNQSEDPDAHASARRTMAASNPGNHNTTSNSRIRRPEPLQAIAPPGAAVDVSSINNDRRPVSTSGDLHEVTL